MSKQRRDVPRSAAPWHRKSRHRLRLRWGEVSSALRSGSPGWGKMLLSSEYGVGEGGGARLGLRFTRIRQPLPSPFVYRNTYSHRISCVALCGVGLGARGGLLVVTSMTETSGALQKPCANDCPA